MKYLFFTLTLVLLLLSCTKETPVEELYPFEGEKVVINASLTPTRTIRVHITKSISPYASGPQEIALVGAEVELYEDGNSLGLMVADTDNFYISPDSLYPAVGKSYQFEVRHPQLEDVETIPEFIPPLTMVDTIITTQVNGIPKVNFTFTDLPSDDAYVLRIVHIGNVCDFGCNMIMGNPFENHPLLCEAKYLYFDDDCISENTLSFSVSLDPNDLQYLVPEGDKIQFSFRTISEASYQYKISEEKYDNYTPGFGDPPIIFSNVIGGYGAVLAYNVDIRMIDL